MDNDIISTRASKCATLAKEYYDKQRANKIMDKCEQVAKEKGHRSLILIEKDNIEIIVNILRESGFIIKPKSSNVMYINW